MSIYAIGDVQGCFNELKKLIERIQFNPNKDTLWFTGDLVNRGPQSLDVLRFIKNLGKTQQIVLGNHDLHLLAVMHGAHPGFPGDTFEAILHAPDRDELMLWLCQQPLLYHDNENQFTLVHAGLSPEWDWITAKKLAHEVEIILQSEKRIDFFREMYQDSPTRWSDVLTGWERLRCITNYFTRVRFCFSDGSLELKEKSGIQEKSVERIPWFQFPDRKNKEMKIIFGHWAALNGVTDTKNVFALDTGCVWGKRLTAMRLEDKKLFSCSC